MDYWELRSAVARSVPRKGAFEPVPRPRSLVKEKGRKGNYHQFDFESGKPEPIQRLLNETEIKSFVEVSLRAAHCPMPLNADVFDSPICPYNCLYCFANSFRASLYSSFFDNAKNMGIRYCNPDYFKAELDKHLRFRGEPGKAGNNPVNRAFALGLPLRFGIRYEDFLPVEERRGISLELLRYLAANDYPVMINTKSPLVGKDEYVRALASNSGRAAVHMTIISSDNQILRRLEPGAPNFDRRLEACRVLVQHGVRVVARIEPFMTFVNDEKSRVDEYIERIKDAGIEHLTTDTYSYSAGGGGLKASMEAAGVDFERMFGLMSDSQGLGSILLSKFHDYLRAAGLKVSTFDFGNVPDNDDDICCQVGDWFRGGFSYGNTTSAIRYVSRQGGRPVSWGEYEKWVDENGGWLSDRLREEVLLAWNNIGNPAYFPGWGRGMETAGMDNEGLLLWKTTTEDFRKSIFSDILRNTF